MLQGGAGKTAGIEPAEHQQVKQPELGSSAN